MIYIYEDEMGHYLNMGFSMNQLYVIPDYEQKPEDDIHENIRKIIRQVLSESITFDNNKTFIPPPNVAQKSLEAINVVKSNNLTKSGTDIGSGLSKAKELSSKQIQSFDMMRKIKSFFDTHEQNYKAEKAAGKNINNSGIIQSWELRGGDSGKEWVDRELNSLKQDNLNTKKNLRKAGGAGENKGMGIFDTKTMSTTNNRFHR